MYDDFFENNEKTFEELMDELDHGQWCALNCLHNLNCMVDENIMEMSDGGEPPYRLTDRGQELVAKYWNEIMKRKPNQEDVSQGMKILKAEGLW